MKEKKRLSALYDFGEAEKTLDGSSDSNSEASYDRADELRRLTYKIEDNTAEMMNYNSIIETSKKSLKEAKKEYTAAKKEYDSKSFGALVADVLVFIGAFFSVYFLVKWLSDKDSSLFKAFLYVSLVFTAATLLYAFYKNFKIRAYRRRMKRAKELMRDSKIWISESERGMRLYEDETRALKKQKKSM